jgi:ABC-type tungstate transport system substrate-binding protein
VKLIWKGIAKAFDLVFGGNAEVWEATWLSLKSPALPL